MKLHVLTMLLFFLRALTSSSGNEILTSPYILTVEGLRIQEVQDSELLKNSLSVALEEVLVEACKCTVEVSEPEISIISHTVQDPLGTLGSGLLFISSLFSDSNMEAEKFEKVTDEIKVRFDVQLSAPIVNDVPVPDSKMSRRHAPGANSILHLDPVPTGPYLYPPLFHA